MTRIQVTEQIKRCLSFTTVSLLQLQCLLFVTSGWKGPPRPLILGLAVFTIMYHGSL